MIKLPIIGNDFGELEENRNKFILYIKVDKERYSTPALGGKMRGVECFKRMTSQIFLI